MNDARALFAGCYVICGDVRGCSMFQYFCDLSYVTKRYITVQKLHSCFDKNCLIL